MFELLNFGTFFVWPQPPIYDSITDGLVSTYRILLYGVEMQRESLCAMPAVSSAICMELIALLVSTPV